MSSAVASTAAVINVWIDIENEPQVQYLYPFAPAFERAHATVTFTARDHGTTLDLLRLRGVTPAVIGARYGHSTIRKGLGMLRRAAALARLMRAARPNLMLGTSRAAVLAAWLLRIPAFAIVDYEHAELQVFRRFGATVMHPDIIPEDVFLDLGYSRKALIPFTGLKEDISLAGVQVEDVEPHSFGDGDLTTVLFRPPAEDSHYFRRGSLELTLALLKYLSRDQGSQVVLAPRTPNQEAYLDRFRWANDPVVLRESIPFVSLLTGVDLVVSSGGTMLREAACLGVPAVSILQSEAARVDRRLEQEGRLTFVADETDFPKIKRAAERSRKPRRPHDSAMLEDLAEKVLARAGTG